MSRTPLRNVTAAVVLTILVCLAAVPAAAQPRRAPEPARVETGLLAGVWLWLTEVWAPAGELERVLEKSTASTSVTPLRSDPATTSGSGGLDRGITIDPNG